MPSGIELFGITLNIDDAILNELNSGSGQLNFDLLLSGTDSKFGFLRVDLLYDEQYKWDTWLTSLVNERQSKMSSTHSRKRAASFPINQGSSPVSKKVLNTSSAGQVMKNGASGFSTKPNFTKAELYHCDSCSYSHANKANMTSHFKMKHDENAPRFNCTMCNYAPKIKQDLKKHYMNVHCLTPELAKAAVAII